MIQGLFLILKQMSYVPMESSLFCVIKKLA